MHPLASLTLVAVLSLAAGRLAAQERHVPDSLAAKAKITEDSARAVALKRVPGDVKEISLAKMRRRLVYTFKVQPTGRQGLTDVQVNAATGHVIAVRRETTKARSTTHRSS